MTMTTKTGFFASAGLALTLVFSGESGFGSETSELYVRAARERYADPSYTNTCLPCFNIDTKYRFDLPSSANETVRWIDVGGARNVRDIGWTGLRRGRVYRGTELNKVGPHGLELTAKGRKVMLEDLGIKTDLDLRAETRTARGDCLDKSALGPDVRFISKPIRPYLEIFGSPLFAETVRIFADPTIYPIYIHCWGGADRTGCLSLVLEGLCGVAEPDLAIDYELTSFGCVGPRLRTGTKGAPFPEVLAKIKSFSGATLRDKFESFVLQDLKLTPEDVAAIRRNLERK